MKGVSLRHSLSAVLNADSLGGWGFILAWNFLGPIILLIFLSILGGRSGDEGYDLLACLFAVSGMLILAASGATPTISVASRYYPFFLTLPLPSSHRILLLGIEHLRHSLAWIIGPLTVFLLLQGDIRSLAAMVIVLVVASAAVGFSSAWNEYFMTYSGVRGSRYLNAGGILVFLGWYLVLKGMYDSATAELSIRLPSGSLLVALAFFVCGWSLALASSGWRRVREGQHFKPIRINPILARRLLEIMDVCEKQTPGIRLLELSDLTKSPLGRWRAFTVYPIQIIFLLILVVGFDLIFPDEQFTLGSPKDVMILFSCVLVQFFVIQDTDRLFLRFIKTMPISALDVVISTLIPLVMSIFFVFVALPWVGVENLGNRVVVCLFLLNYGIGTLALKSKLPSDNQFDDTKESQNFNFPPLSGLYLLWVVALLVLLGVSIVGSIPGVFVPIWCLISGLHLWGLYWMWKRY